MNLNIFKLPLQTQAAFWFMLLFNYLNNEFEKKRKKLCLYLDPHVLTWGYLV